MHTRFSLLCDVYALSLICTRLFVTPACRPPAPLSMGILQARILEWVAMPSARGSPQTWSSILQVDSLWSEPPGNVIFSKGEASWCEIGARVLQDASDSSAWLGS